MQIRPERVEDIENIWDLDHDAFLEDPHHEPGSEPMEPKIVDELRAEGQLTLSLVADDEGVLTGHLAVSPVRVAGADLGWFGLGPVAVSPERQNQGIGSSLIWSAVEELQERGAAGLVVLGDPGYYERFGFRAVPEMRLENVPPEYFMVLPFKSKIPGGFVTYQDAFYQGTELENPIARD